MVDRLSSELIEAIFSDDGEHRVGLSPAKLRQIVRRLLTAMREPTAAMVEAAYFAADPNDEYLPGDACEVIWRAAVDAAMED